MFLQPRTQIDKPAAAQKVYGFDWTARLAGNLLTANTWAVGDVPVGDASPPTLDNAAILDSTGLTAARLLGGTRDTVYKITNQVGISGLPAQIDEEWFYVRIL